MIVFNYQKIQIIFEDIGLLEYLKFFFLSSDNLEIIVFLHYFIIKFSCEKQELILNTVYKSEEKVKRYLCERKSILICFLLLQTLTVYKQSI